MSVEIPLPLNIRLSELQPEGQTQIKAARALLINALVQINDVQGKNQGSTLRDQLFELWDQGGMTSPESLESVLIEKVGQNFVYDLKQGLKVKFDGLDDVSQNGNSLSPVGKEIIRWLNPYPQSEPQYASLQVGVAGVRADTSSTPREPFSRKASKVGIPHGPGSHARINGFAPRDRDHHGRGRTNGNGHNGHH